MSEFLPREKKCLFQLLNSSRWLYPLCYITQHKYNAQATFSWYLHHWPLITGPSEKTDVTFHVSAGSTKPTLLKYTPPLASLLSPRHHLGRTLRWRWPWWRAATRGRRRAAQPAPSRARDSGHRGSGAQSGGFISSLERLGFFPPESADVCVCVCVCVCVWVCVWDRERVGVSLFKILVTK